MNLSGKWKYTEDYSHGDSIGELSLTQNGGILKGKLTHTESPLGGNSFTIEQELAGNLNTKSNRIYLKAISYKLISSLDDIIYELDTFEAQIINENTIVGTTEDKQGILGVFCFKRE